MDWTDGNSSVSDHFSVSDCLTLHSWNRLATEEDGADFDKLTTLCQVLEQVRAILGAPMSVHCMFRSADYNIQIGANPTDPHNRSMACDFDCNPKLTCDEVKNILMPHLESLNMRMEDNGNGASWVHLDLCPVLHNRFFKP
jgi:Peptidase M15